MSGISRSMENNVRTTTGWGAQHTRAYCVPATTSLHSRGCLVPPSSSHLSRKLNLFLFTPLPPSSAFSVFWDQFVKEAWNSQGTPLITTHHCRNGDTKGWQSSLSRVQQASKGWPRCKVWVTGCWDTHQKSWSKVLPHQEEGAVPMPCPQPTPAGRSLQAGVFGLHTSLCGELLLLASFRGVSGWLCI